MPRNLGLILQTRKLLLPGVFFAFLTCLQGKQTMLNLPYSFTVSHVTGIAHMVLKKEKPVKQPLNLSAVVESSSVYSVVVGKDSYLELTKSDQESDMVTPLIRLGSKSVLEIRPDHSLFMFQGSALFCHKNTSIQLFCDQSILQIFGEGTWLVEKTSIGFKIIVLEGRLFLNNQNSALLPPGSLTLVSGKNGQKSQHIDIELPLLLSTSRLLNSFPSLLPSRSRISSAAFVQTMRTKSKYDALIGNVNKDRKLQILSIGQRSK